MVDLFMISLAIPVFILIWHFHKQTSTDECRDELFVLRARIRQHFLDNNIPIDTLIYKNLRDLINSHLRYTEGYTVWSMFYFAFKLRRNQDLEAELHRRLKARFEVNDPELAAFVDQTRKEANDIMTGYMAVTSVVVLTALFVSLPFMLLYYLRHYACRQWDKSGALLVQRLVSLEASEGAVMGPCTSRSGSTSRHHSVVLGV